VVHVQAPGLWRKHMTEPVPSTAHGLMADLDFSFVEEIVDVPKRRRQRT
jgi:hypothetical protein